MKQVNPYFVFLLCALPFCFASTTIGQIMYTDVNPDSTVAASTVEVNKSYYLDLDNDGIYEWELRHFNPGPPMLGVEIHSNRSSVTPSEVLLSSDGSYCRAMSIGEVFGPASGPWGNPPYNFLFDGWEGAGDKYYPVRFLKGGNIYYGWARLNIPSGSPGFTIKDYAYNSIPNAPITCDIPTSVELDQDADRPDVETQILGDILYVKARNAHNMRVTVRDLLGRARCSAVLVEGEARVVLETLPYGVYFVLCENGLSSRVVDRFIYR